ncbi:MAG: hypothetical protein WBI20_01385 [Burkholderiaceae bacterium]
MHRRSFFARLALSAAWPLLPLTHAFAHTPYRFWDVFRKQNMQILTSHADYTGDDVGEDWVAVLRENLPLSRAMVSRAHDIPRIASLLKTNQVKIAVLSYLHARLLFTGEPPFEEFAPLPLNILVDNGKYLLVTRPDLPLYHGYLLTVALMEAANKLQLINPGKGRFGMALHAGSKAFFNGEKPEPPPPVQ